MGSECSPARVMFLSLPGQQLSSRTQTAQRWIGVPASVLIVSMATLVHAYTGIKLLLLLVCALGFAVNVCLDRVHLVVYPRLVWFYLSIAVVGVVWAVVGLLHPYN